MTSKHCLLVIFIISISICNAISKSGNIISHIGDLLSTCTKSSGTLGNNISAEISSKIDDMESLKSQRFKRSYADEIDPLLGLKPRLPFPTQILDELFGRRLFNTTMNYIIPLFEVVLPMHTDQGSTVHLAMQAFLGLFSAIAWVATVALPVILLELTPFGLKKRNGNFNANEIVPPDPQDADADGPSFLKYSITSGKLPSLFDEKTSKQVGLEWRPCLDKTICDAHRSPKKYGVIGLPFRILFPLPSHSGSGWHAGEANFAYNSTKSSASDSDLTYRAAYLGINSKEECGKLFHCFFDVLDLMEYFTHVWIT